MLLWTTLRATASHEDVGQNLTSAVEVIIHCFARRWVGANSRVLRSVFLLPLSDAQKGRVTNYRITQNNRSMLVARFPVQLCFTAIRKMVEPRSPSCQSVLIQCHTFIHSKSLGNINCWNTFCWSKTETTENNSWKLSERKIGAFICFTVNLSRTIDTSTKWRYVLSIISRFSSSGMSETKLVTAYKTIWRWAENSCTTGCSVFIHLDLTSMVYLIQKLCLFLLAILEELLGTVTVTLHS